jgi:tetratricopeptide (TPR) repeat protein
MIMLLLVVTLGCKQRQEQKQQVTYSPAPAPAMMQIDQLQQAARMAPKNAQAWIELGNALMDTQRYGEAIDAYDKALALDPKNVNVLVDQGTCYRGIGKFDKAVEQYRKALKIDPKFPNGHRNLAVVLAYDLKNTKEGIKEFQKYLEIAPNAPDVETIRQTVRELQAKK